MDIAFTFDGAALSFDWQLTGGDLGIDGGLRSAVIVSLFTDRQAEDDDVLPTGGTDRRGWWGDLKTDGSAAPAGDRIGSLLWLLGRELATEETRQRAVDYAGDALAWLIDDGVAQTVDVDATLTGAPASRSIALQITITRRDGTSTKRDVFDLLWSAETGN